jgi:hypothetical protein
MIAEGQRSTTGRLAAKIGNVPELTAGRAAGDDRVQLTGYSA